MSDLFEFSNSGRFQLRAYLAADLRRAEYMLRGSFSAVGGIRFWIGICSPRFLPVLLCRIAHCFHCWKLNPVAKLIALCNFFFFGIEIAVRCPIGKGLFLPHTQGTVIGAWSIGENATIFQGVTLGAKEVDFSYQKSSRPVLGDGVTIGSGAKVLGGIAIGSNSRIGANAVVLTDIPRDSLAVGIPARVVDKGNANHAI
jgi:serine O-acetyltransferase